MKFRNSINGAVFLSTVLALTLGSCKKDAFLNVPPKGSLTNVTTFSGEQNADLFVNDIYNQLPDLNQEDEILDQYTDNSGVGATWMTGQSLIRSNAMNPVNLPHGPNHMFYWQASGTDLGNYEKIRKCNVFLQQAALYKANFSDKWYDQRVAEVKFLRAYYYSVLLTNYGGVPIISVPLNNGSSSDTLFYPRSSFDETQAFIEADLDAAAAVLPVTVGSGDLGRATKGAALTLKGWVELFAASPLVNTSNDPSKWAKAAAANQAVIDLGVYGLFDDYAAQFLAANNWNKEQIFARGYALPNRGHRREGLLGPTIVHGTEQAWGNITPTQNLVDDYEMDNGLPITDPASGYDPQHPYKGREQRFYQSIIYDGSEWQGDTIYTRLGGNNAIDIGSTNDITNTGYYGRKTLDESINGQISLGVSPGTSNYTYFRYAEVLLSYAEAQNEAVGPDASVYAAVDAVRGRSALPPLPAGLTQDQMRTIIRRDRRIEFAFEDKRWYDIRRWDITTKGPAVLTTPTYGMQISKDGLTFTKVVVWPNTFSEYMNWLPIPQPAKEQNPKLTQNPGYPQ